MSRQTFIFVSARAQDLMHLVEQAVGGRFIHEEGSDPYIRHPRVGSPSSVR
jgi:hypothetical protein